MKKLQKAGTIIVSVLLWAIILLAGLFAFTTLATQNQSQVASVFGYTPMVVQSESMEPVFYKKDLIVIKKCDPATLKVDDIVTFPTVIDNEYALNTHRIVSIENQELAGKTYRAYTTRGDNTPDKDPHIIGDSDIVGKYVFRVPKLGKVLDVLTNTYGFLLIIVLPMLAFFIYQVYHLITVSIKLKKAVAVESAQEEGGALAEAEKARAEAEAALAEAKRLKEEAAALAKQAGNAPDAPAPAEEQPAESDPAN